MTTHPTVVLRMVVSDSKKVRKVLNESGNPHLYNITFSRMIPASLISATEITKRVVHVVTGNLRDAITWDYDTKHTRGRVFLNPRIVYARGNTLQWPWIYGYYEHRRGGDHAFFERAYMLNWSWTRQGMRISIDYLKRRLG